MQPPSPQFFGASAPRFPRLQQRFRYVSIHSYTLSAGLRTPNRCERIRERAQVEIDGVCRIRRACLMQRESHGGNSKTAAEQVEESSDIRESPNEHGESARTMLSKHSGFTFRRAPMKSDLASNDATTWPLYRKCMRKAQNLRAWDATGTIGRGNCSHASGDLSSDVD